MVCSSQARFSLGLVPHQCALKPRPPPNSSLPGMRKKNVTIKKLMYMHKPFPGERLSALMKTKFGVAIFWPLRKKDRALHACRATLTWTALPWGWCKQGRQQWVSPHLELHAGNYESKSLSTERQNIKLSHNIRLTSLIPIWISACLLGKASKDAREAHDAFDL